MAVEVQQLRPEGLPDLIEFAGSVDCPLQAEAVDPRISLVAREGDDIVAAVLGVKQPGTACELHVCLKPGEHDDTLTAELLNKALMKVHSLHLRRCQIFHHGPEQPPAGWPAPRWIGEEPEEADTAQPQTPEKKPEAETLVDDTADVAETDDTDKPVADTPGAEAA
ncbi:MAG: hypothetical protein Kow00105_05170 [Phycisphaeraceae bacterium]